MISIDWPNKVILIPKADLTLIQSTPVEIRELDINTFRLTLKDLEDDEVGMSFQTTHNHNPPVTVGGVTLARVVEIINDYTITFEDGSYAVNLVGANSNIGDRVNLNSVSIRSANSAGLVQTREIEYSAFQNQVTIDVLNGTSGTIYPIGTIQSPVNNLTDAKLIASVRGINSLFIIGDATFDATADFAGFHITGHSLHDSTVTIEPDANVEHCEFRDCIVTGTLDGGNILERCSISDLNYVNGLIIECLLNPGTITLAPDLENNAAHFLNCWSGVPGLSTPTIDMGGNGPALGMRGYNGGIRLINKTGTEAVSIDLNSGQVILDSTIANGTIVVRGVGMLTNNAVAPAIVNSVNLINNTGISNAIWNKATSELTTPNSTGSSLVKIQRTTADNQVLILAK